MTRALARAAATAVLGGLAGAAWLVPFYGIESAVRIELDDSPPRLVSGLYPVERDHASGLTFAWTGGLMTLRLPGLDRRVDWQFDMRARAARADPTTNPDLLIFADGTLLLTLPSSPDFTNVRVTVPAQPERHGLTLAVQSSKTVVPGPHDPRPLGVMVDWMSLSSGSIAMPPGRALLGAAAATAVVGAAAALLGFSSLAAAGIIVLIGAANASLLARGFGPYTDYPSALTWLTAWIWLAALVIHAGVMFARHKPLSGAASCVLAFSAGAVLVKLAVLFHPDMPIGDALFHAHRFQGVLGGNLYFTSIAPGNYAFPYAPGLYVFAMPFAGLVPRGDADMFLLRSIVVAVDAVAGAFLYIAVVRAGLSSLAGAMTVVLYHVVPLEFQIVTVGNLSNAFSQSLAAIALALMAASLFESARLTTLLTVVLLAAFLSHTSTFAIGTIAAGTVAVLLHVRGRAALRPAAMAIGLSVIAAATGAVLLYYAHFTDVYRSEWARISVEAATAAPDAGGRSIAERLGSVPRYLYLYLGPPVLGLAAWGTRFLRRPPSNARLAITVAGWTVTCLVFLVIGVLTPVDMRHYLAVIPALAIAAGVAAAGGFAAGGRQRVLAVVLLGWAIAIFVQTWWNTI